jgi:hypothetical protein
MSGTTNLPASNKDKVANKFGIQLKPKDTNKPSLSPTTEKKSINTETTTVLKNKTVSDFRVQNESNGFQTKTNTINHHSTSSKTPEPTRKNLENSTKSKSSIALVSVPTTNERRDSLTSNVNHSTSLNPVKSLSQSLSSKSPEIIKRSSLISISIDPRSSLSSKDRSKSPEPSSIKRLSITKTPERNVSPGPSSIRRLSITKTPERSVSPGASPMKRISVTKTPERSVSPGSSIRRTSGTKTPEQTSPALLIKRPSISTTTKTEAQIEHQKDQPLYKRQLSKTLDNVTSMTNKNKHQHELSTALAR